MALYDPKLLPSEAETSGWTIARQHGEGLTLYVAWQRGRYEIQFSAHGHSWESYKPPRWSTRPFALWTPETGTQTSPSGRLRGFSSFKAALAAIEEHERRLAAGEIERSESMPTAASS